MHLQGAFYWWLWSLTLETHPQPLREGPLNPQFFSAVLLDVETRQLRRPAPTLHHRSAVSRNSALTAYRKPFRRDLRTHFWGYLLESLRILFVPLPRTSLLVLKVASSSPIISHLSLPSQVSVDQRTLWARLLIKPGATLMGGRYSHTVEGKRYSECRIKWQWVQWCSP